MRLSSRLIVSQDIASKIEDSAENPTPIAAKLNIPFPFQGPKLIRAEVTAASCKRIRRLRQKSESLRSSRGNYAQL